MYYASIGHYGTGFTNQIFSLITHIILAYKRNEKVIVVDGFLDDIHQTTYTPLADIFNLPQLNLFLKKTYNILIIDKDKIHFEILSAYYGTADTYLDITDFFKQYTHALVIPKHYPFNSIQGDPCPGIVKQCTLTYRIHGYVVEEIYPENMLHDIRMDKKGPYTYTFGWMNSLNETMFTDILQHITYHEEFIVKANINVIHSKINVIHLRVEDDAIAHWSKQNHMTPHDFKTYVEDKYIHLIKTYLSKDEETILLSSSLSNRVIDFLKEHEYPYTCTHKYFKEREKNAIVDLLVATRCNHIFIGNFNVATRNGSSFSYYIGKQLQKNVKHIYIDLDNINAPEVFDKFHNDC